MGAYFIIEWQCHWAEASDPIRFVNAGDPGLPQRDVCCIFEGLQSDIKGHRVLTEEEEIAS